MRLHAYDKLNQYSSKQSLPKPTEMQQTLQSANRQAEKSNLMELIGQKARSKQLTNPEISKTNLANLINTLTETSS